MSDVTARQLTVSGRVQGVNYRAWVADRARSRRVAGWAENRADGSVEVWLQGPAAAVADVERAVGEGPRYAQVERIDARDAPPRDDLEGFTRR